MTEERKLAPIIVIDLAVILRGEGTGAERVAEALSTVNAIERAIEQAGGGSLKVHEIRFSQ